MTALAACILTHHAGTTCHCFVTGTVNGCTHGMRAPARMLGNVEDVIARLKGEAKKNTIKSVLVA